MNKLTGIVMSVMLTASLAIGAGNIVPPSDGGANLGTASLQWGEVQAKSIVSTNIGGSEAALTVSNVTAGGSATVAGTLGVTGVTTVGTKINMSTNVSMFTGILTSRATLVTSTLTTNCAIGSIYFSNGGKVFLRVGNSNPDATNDWYIVDTDNSDESSP